MHDHRAPSVLRLRRATLVVLAGVTVSTVLAGCSLFGSSSQSSYSGPAVPAGSARAGSQLEQVTPSATGSAAAAAASAAAASAAASAIAAKGTPYVEAIQQKGCTPKTFVEQASLVSGAIHVYITAPLPTGSGSAAVRAKAASAAGYAARTLGAGAAAIEGCSTTKSLAAVSKQNVTQLKALSTELAKGDVPASKVQAVDAMFANVQTQAKRLNLVIVEKTPTPQQLVAD